MTNKKMIKGLSGCFFSLKFYYIDDDGFIVTRIGNITKDKKA